MKKTIFTSIILLFYIGHGISQDKTETPETLLEELIQKKHVIGASAGYSVNGEVKWISAVGFADNDKKTDFNINTKIRTASIAKSMTAVAIMQLVEDGLIDLNLPIDDYIPEFIQKHKTKITTQHILSHTSGIDAYKNRKEIKSKINYPTLLDAYTVFKDRKLRFEPGTEFYYTTYGYVVLGILIEKVSGMSYDNYMQKNIWNKVEMTNTGIEKPETKKQNSATLYHRDRKGKIEKGEVNNLSNRIPGGGLYSTTGDLLKFGNALLNNTLVSQETIKLMTEHHSLEKVNNGYGFGFYLYGQQPDEGSIYGHNGAQIGTSTQLFIIPSQKTVTVAVSNTSGAGKEVSTLAAKLYSISKKIN